MFWGDLTFEWYEDAMIFRVFIVIFRLATNARKHTWMRMISITVMVIFSELPFWKLFYHSYFQNSILKDTIQLKILWTWIKIGANSFIKTWVNIIKRKSTKVLENYQLHKNPSLHLKENCTAQKFMAFHLFVHAIFFLKKLLFKFNPVFFGMLDSLR